jgi:hypothetical protein
MAAKICSKTQFNGCKIEITVACRVHLIFPSATVHVYL